jgi:hypothetical protein
MVGLGGGCARAVAGCDDGAIEGGGPGGRPSTRNGRGANAVAAAGASQEAGAAGTPAENPLLGEEFESAAAAAADEAWRPRRSATDRARMVSTVRGGDAGASILLALIATWRADSSDPDDGAAAVSAEGSAPPGASLDSSLDEVDCDDSPAALALRASSIARTSSTDCARCASSARMSAESRWDEATPGEPNAASAGSDILRA